MIRNHFYFSSLALLLFTAGFAFSYIVDRFDIKFLKAFPIWFLRFTLKIISFQSPFILVFLFIFSFNSIAIFLYMLSGLFVVFPFIIAVLTGLNVGIISLYPADGGIYPIPPDLEGKTCLPAGRTIFRKEDHFQITLSLIFVPVFELLVFCVSMALGMSMGISMYQNFNLFNAYALAIPRIIAYVTYGIPLLFISALLEAKVVKDIS